MPAASGAGMVADTTTPMFQVASCADPPFLGARRLDAGLAVFTISGTSTRCTWVEMGPEEGAQGQELHAIRIPKDKTRLGLTPKSSQPTGGALSLWKLDVSTPSYPRDLSTHNV